MYKFKDADFNQAVKIIKQTDFSSFTWGTRIRNNLFGLFLVWFPYGFLLIISYVFSHAFYKPEQVKLAFWSMTGPLTVAVIVFYILILWPYKTFGRKYKMTSLLGMVFFGLVQIAFLMHFMSETYLTTGQRWEVYLQLALCVIGLTADYFGAIASWKRKIFKKYRSRHVSTLVEASVVLITLALLGFNAIGILFFHMGEGGIFGHRLGNIFFSIILMIFYYGMGVFQIRGFGRQVLSGYYMEKFSKQVRLHFRVPDGDWYLSERERAKHEPVYPPVQVDEKND